MRDLSTPSLVTLCIKRNRLAWDKFVERFSPLVFWAIKRTLKRLGHNFSRQDTEDIFQDVFVLLWEKGKLRQIKDRKQIAGWLAAVSVNCTYNFFRYKPFLKETLSANTSFASFDTEKNTNRQRLERIFEEIMDTLPADELIMLKLNYYHRKTHNEIGKLLKVPANTISSTIKRSKEKLKKELIRQGWEES